MKKSSRSGKVLGEGIFLLLLLALSWWFNYHVTFTEPPQSVHTWRQTNGLSIARIYYQYNVPFLQPEIHNQISAQGLSGKSAGEFPVIYYTVAQLWKITGPSEASFRLLHLFLLFIGLLMLFRLLSDITGDSISAGFVSMLVFTSPMVIFYGPNFLPDVPSLSITFIAWFSLYRFSQSGKYRSLIFSALFFSLAISLKITSALSFIALGGWILLEMFFLKPSQRIFSFRWVQILPFVLGGFLVLVWYLYVEKYNALHGGSFSYHGIWPVWSMSGEQFTRITDALDKIWFKEFFWPPLQYATLVIWMFLIVNIRKLPLFLGYLLIVMPLGLLGILLLWFQVLEGHDYYMITQIQVLVVVWGAFVYYLRQLPAKFAIPRGLVMVILFLVLAQNGRVRHLARYEGWMNEGFKLHLEALTEIEPYFVTWGIEPEAKVISIPDPSINASLYYMNRKGYTNFASDFSREEEFKRRISQGAGFLIVNDSTLLNSDPVQKFTGYRIGEYRNLSVYDLRPYLLK